MSNMSKKILVEVSARHIHLSQKDLEVLFGKGYKLKELKKLPTTNQFAAKETLDIKVGSEKISKVRIVGPLRKKTQVELSITDAINLGINPLIRKSGDLKGTPGVTLVSPKRKIKLKSGVIIAWRHIHCSPKEAKALNFKEGKLVSIKIRGKRFLIFHNVKVRIDKNFRLCVHLDTDEGNAAGITKKGKGTII